MNRSKTIQVRITAKELRTWKRHAKLNGVTLSAWIRAKCQGHVGDSFGALFRRESEQFADYVKRMGAGKYKITLHPWKQGKP